MEVGHSFTIVVDSAMNRIRLIVVKVAETSQVEQFDVVARNKTLVIQGNRPLLRGKGLRRRKINWQLVQGTLSNISLLEKIIKHIDQEVRRDESDTPGWVHPKNK